MARKALSSETPELPISINAQVVRQLRSWKAHSDSVRSLNVHSDPPCILTAGYDHMVKIWEIEGNGVLMTVLRAYGTIPWNFPVKAETIALDEETVEKVAQAVRRDEEERERQLCAETAVAENRKRSTVPAFCLPAEVKMHQQRLADHEERQRVQQKLRGPSEPHV